MVTKRTPISHAEKLTYPPIWATDARPVSLECWQKHRARFMRDEPDGHRPDEWWLYEKQMQPPAQETVALYEMGELGEAELGRLTALWRERYEQAQRPGFRHCIGQANPGDTFASWVEGAEARRQHYRWAQIPPALLKQWDAERKRSAKTIRKLAKTAKAVLP
jgi:hypothetical protein